MPLDAVNVALEQAGRELGNSRFIPGNTASGLWDGDAGPKGTASLATFATNAIVDVVFRSPAMGGIERDVRLLPGSVVPSALPALAFQPTCLHRRKGPGAGQPDPAVRRHRPVGQTRGVGPHPQIDG